MVSARPLRSTGRALGGLCKHGGLLQSSKSTCLGDWCSPIISHNISCHKNNLDNYQPTSSMGKDSCSFHGSNGLPELSLLDSGWRVEPLLWGRVTEMRALLVTPWDMTWEIWASCIPSARFKAPICIPSSWRLANAWLTRCRWLSQVHTFPLVGWQIEGYCQTANR